MKSRILSRLFASKGIFTRTDDRGKHAHPHVECLESRIAPASISLLSASGRHSDFDLGDSSSYSLEVVKGKLEIFDSAHQLVWKHINSGIRDLSIDAGDSAFTLTGPVQVGHDLNLIGTGALTVNGLVRAGHEIDLQGGFVTVTGSLVAKNAGLGGEIVVTGDNVALLDHANINASGANAGGTVLIGGDYEGDNANVKNAQKVLVESGVQIHADALNRGAGGKVILFAEEALQFTGVATAKGGKGGKGGFVETSADVVQLLGTVNVSSLKGQPQGTWLVDPNNLRIGQGGDFNITSGPGFFDTNGDDAFLTVASLNAALNAGGNVFLTTKTNGANSQEGRIEIWDTVTKSSGADSTLTFNAHTSVIFSNVNGDGNAPALISTSGKLNVQVNTNYDNDSSSGGFYMLYDSGNNIAATINTNGGSFTTNTVVGPTDKGVYIDHGTITTGAGNITITGQGDATSGGGPSTGIDITNSSTLTTTTGSVFLTGTGGAVNDQFTRGVSVSNNSVIQTTGGGNITITTKTNGTGSDAQGFALLGGGSGGSSVRVTGGSGTITITDTTTIDGSDAHGIYLDGSSTLSATGTGTVSATTTRDILVQGGASVTTANGALTLSANQQVTPTAGSFYGLDINGLIRTAGTGNIVIAGRSGSSGSGNEGIIIEESGLIQSTASGAGAGTITLTGVSGESGSVANSEGVTLVNGGIETVDGAITITGTGANASGASNTGVLIADFVSGTAHITATGTASLAITGTGFGSSGFGVNVLGFQPTSLSTASGNITLTGTGAGAAGVATSGSNTVSSSADNINIVSDATEIGGGTVTAGGTVTIRQITNGTAIDLGTETAGSLSLTDAELDRITAATVQIGDGNSGAITVSAAITHGNNLSLTTGAGVSGSGALTLAAGKNLGITSNGAINLTGAIIVPGTTTLSAGADAISLTNAGNDFGGAVTLSNSGANGASITDTNALTLGVSNIGSGASTFTANNLTVSGAITSASGGSTNVVAPTISLQAPIVHPGGALTGTGAAIFVSSAGLIQNGVDVAASGATVNVAAGTFTENLSVTKSLTLKGAQTGVDARGRVVGAPNPAVETVVTPLAAGTATMTVAFNGTLTVDGFAFTGGTALGVIQTTVGPNNGMQIINNHFSGYSQSAVFMNRGGSDITIDQNVMDGSNIAGSGQAIFANGPQSYTGLWITNNNVINNAGRYGFFVDGTHNVGESATRAPKIDGNLFDNNLQGLNLGSRSFGTNAAPVLGAYGGYITNNTFSNNTANGIQAGIQHVLVSGNTFLNNAIDGLALTSFGNTGADRGAQNSLITQNFFSGNGSEDLIFSTTQAAGTISTNIATGNSFASTKGVTYGGTETINVSANWWNSITGPTVASNAGGTGAQISGAGAANIDYTPWLNLGTDTSGTTGFQGDYSLLTVNAGSPQSGATGRITEAIGLLADGSVNGVNRTVFAKAGTYGEAVNISATGATPATLDLSGGITINSLTGLATSVVQLHANTLTVGDATSTAFGGAINGAGGGLTKQGGGTLTLSGANGYTGTTLISAGTLSVTGSIANSVVTVGNTGTLGGTGTTGSVTANSGGHLAPGTSPGTLSTGSVSLTSGSTFDVEVNGNTVGTHDELDVTGTVDLGGATLNASGTITSSTGQIIVLIDNDGGEAVTGTFAGLPEGSDVLINGVHFAISYAGGSGNDVVLYEADTNVHLDGSGNLVIDDVALGNNDNLTIQADTANSRYIITNAGLTLYTIIPGATGSGSSTIFVPFGAVTGPQIDVNTFGGNDALTVDFSLGNFTKAINYDGGTQTTSDSLTLTGGTFASVAHTFVDASTGSVAITGNSTISYTGLEPVIDNLSATNRSFTFTGGGETISLVDGGSGTMTIDSTLGESVNFTDPTSTITINANNGVDAVTITSMNAGYSGSLSIATDGGDTATISGGLPTLSSLSVTADTIHLNSVTTTGAQTFTGNTLLDSGTTLTSTGGGAIGFTGSIDGNFAFAANTAGAVSIGDAVGGGSPLLSFAIAGASSATLDDVTATGGINIGATTINLGGDLHTDGGNVALTGNVHLGASITIDTETGADNSAGSVTLSGGTTSATVAGVDLTIDTSTVGFAGGAVALNVFGNAVGQYINDVSINTGGASVGLLTLNGNISLDENTAADPASFTLLGGGKVAVAAATTIDTEQGNTAGVDGGAVNLGTGAIYGTSAVALQILTNTSAAGRTAGAITLGPVGDNGGANNFLSGLTLNATATTNGVVTLGGDIFIDGAFAVTGRVVLPASRTIDTEQGNNNVGGSVQFLGDYISASASGVDLMVNSSVVGFGGGVIQLNTMTNDAGAYLNDVTVNSGGTTNGTVTLRGNISLDNNGADLASFTVLGGGLITFAPTAVTIDTEQGGDSSGGSVDFGTSTMMGTVRDVTIDTSSAQVGGSGGNVTLGQVSQAGSFLHSLTINASGNGAGAAGTIKLQGNVSLDETPGNPASFTAQGDILIAPATGTTLTIDTEQGNTAGAAGNNVNLGNARIFAAAPGYTLTIDTGNSGAGSSGGAATLGTFTNASGSFLKSLAVTTTGSAVNGAITLNGDIFVEGGAVTLNAGTGNIVLPGSRTIDTNQTNAASSGAVTLTGAISASVIGADLTIDTSTTFAGGNSGAVTLGAIANTAGQYINDLTVNRTPGAGGTAGGLTLSGSITTNANGGDTGDISFSGAGAITLAALPITIASDATGGSTNAGTISFNDTTLISGSQSFSVNSTADGGGTAAATTLAPVSLSSGSVTVNSGPLTFNSITTVNGNVVLNGIGVTQNAATSVSTGTGTIAIDGGGGAINLQGSLTSTDLTASAITIQDATTVALGSINATGGAASGVVVGVGANVTGAVTQNVGTTITANNFTANTTGAILLTNSTNDFGTVTLTNTGAGNVAVTDTNAVVLGGLNVGTGTLAVTAVGITQTGNVVQAAGAGAVALDGGAGSIVLASSGNNFTGPVSASVGVGSISITDGSGGLDVTSATTTNGAITLQAIGGNLSVTTATAGTGGAINLSTTTSGDVRIGNVTTTGTATISAAGKIEELGSDAAADLTADTANLTATTGIGTAGTIETALSNLGATSATGGIDIENTGVLTLTGYSGTTSGNLTLLNHGALTTSGTVSATSGTISITTTSPMTIGANMSASGNITLTAGEISDAPTFADNLQVNSGVTVQSTGGTVTLRAGDDVTLLAGSVVTAPTVSIQPGFGDLDGGGNANLLGTINTTSAFNLSAIGDIVVGLINDPGQTVSLTADSDHNGTGGILDSNGAAVNVIASALNLSASTRIAASPSPGAFGITLDTQVNSIAAVVANGAGGIDISNTGALNVTSATTSDGSISLNATGGNLTLAGINAGGTGDITLTTTTSGSVLLGDVTAVGNTINVTSAAAITESSGGFFNGSVLNTSSATGQNLAGPNTVGTVSATNTTSGDIFFSNTAATLLVQNVSNPVGNGAISNTGNISVNTVSVSGNALLVATGAITDANAAAVNITAATAQFSANNGFGTALDPIETTINRVEGGSVTGGIYLTETDALIIGGISAANGLAATTGDIVVVSGALTVQEDISTANNVTLTAAGAITETLTGKIHGALLTTSSAGGQTLNNANTVASFNATNTTSGNVSLVNTAATLTITGISNVTGATTTTVNNTGAIALNGNITATAATGNVSLTASGAITHASGTITGNALTLTAGGPDGDIGAIGAAILTSGNSVAFTGTGTGDIFITEADDAAISGSTGTGNINLVSTGGSLTLGLVSTSTAVGVVNITAANSILDGNVNSNNIAAHDAILTSGTGVGAVGDKLDSTVVNLEGTGGSGGFFLSDTGTLNIGGISALVGVSATGDIAITNTGALTISELVQTAGNVTLTASGTIAETGGAIVTPATLTTSSAGGQTLNDAGNQIGTFSATNTGAGTGISLQNNFGGFNIFTVTNKTGGSVSINNAGTDANITGVITSGNPVLGGNITVQTAGLLTVNNTVDSRGGSGGTLTLGGLLMLNASPIVGFGNITLQGGAGPLTINAPITLSSPLVLQSTEDVNILAKVETTSVTSDITVLADSDNDGDGGVYIANNALYQGSLKAGRNLDVRGSDYLDSYVTLGVAGDSVIIEPNGANARLEAVGDVLVKNNTGAPASARIFLGGLVRSNTNGNVTFDNAIQLIDDSARALTHGTGNVIFLGAIDGGFDLRASTDSGVVLLNGAIGAVTRVGDVLIDTALDVTEIGGLKAASFTVGSATGTVELGGAVDTNGAGTNLSINSNTLLVNNTVTSNAGSIFWQTDNLAVSGATSGTGVLTIQPVTVGRSIGLNGTGDLNLTQAEINLFQDGFAQIVIGRVDGFGAVATAGVTFSDPVTILSPAAGGLINVNGTIAGTDNASVTMQAPTINLNVTSPAAAISTDADLVHLIGNIKLLTNTLIDTNFAGAGGNVTLDGTINGGFDLNIDAGNFAAGGTVAFNGGAGAPNGVSVGGSTPLTSLTVSGAAIVMHPQVITTGAQTYNAATNIDTYGGALRSKTSGAITLNGPVTLHDVLPIVTSGLAGSDVIFTSTVNTFPGSPGALRIDAGTLGNVTFGGNVGTLPLAKLQSLEVTRANNIVFNGGVSVVNALKLDAAEIDFNGGVDSVLAGTLTLQTDGANQAVVVGGAADTGANVLDITATDIAALADGIGSILIARTAGTAGITLAAAGVTFSDPVTFRQSSRTGFIDVLGNVTGTDNASLTFTGSATNLGGDLTTAGGAITTDYINLTTNVHVTSGGGAVTFNNTLLDTGVGGHSLTISSGAGDVSFLGAVGTSGSLLGDVSVTSGGITQIKKSLVAKSFTTDAAGSTQLQGTQIKATDAAGTGIVINDPVTLNSSMRILTSGTAPITLGAGVNSRLGKTYSLTLQSGQGDITVNGAVGDTAILATLRARATADITFTGAITTKAVNLHGLAVEVDAVTTSSTQTYNAQTIALDGPISASKLNVKATANISTAEAFNVVGQATFKTIKTADITLSNAANAFGLLSLAGHNATIVETDDTHIVSTKLTGTLDLTSGGNVLQSGVFAASTLDVDAAGTISFTGSGQKISHLGTIAGVGDIVILAGGSDLFLDGPITTTNGDVTIAANYRGTFHNIFNLGGANVITITGSGRYLIYAYRQSISNLGALAPSFIEVGKTYPTAPDVGHTGSGFIFAKG